MWAHVLQQDGAGTVRKAVQSLPKVILVLLSMYVLSSSLYKLQVLGSSDLGRGSPTTCRVSGGGTATPSSGPPTATALVQVIQLESCLAAGLGMCREGIPVTCEEAGTCQDASQLLLG